MRMRGSAFGNSVIFILLFAVYACPPLGIGFRVEFVDFLFHSAFFTYFH